jgi:hypothetical protein
MRTLSGSHDAVRSVLFKRLMNRQDCTKARHPRNAKAAVQNILEEHVARGSRCASVTCAHRRVDLPGRREIAQLRKPLGRQAAQKGVSPATPLDGGPMPSAAVAATEAERVLECHARRGNVIGRDALGDQLGARSGKWISAGQVEQYNGVTKYRGQRTKGRHPRSGHADAAMN